MNSSNYRFTLDIQSRQSQVSLPAMKNDTARTLRITLADGGEPYTIADGCIATFVAKKPDGNTIFNSCIIEGNTVIRYTLTTQTTSAYGVVNCEIRLYGADGMLITSPRFILVVDSRVAADDELVESETEHEEIDKIMLSETERIEAESARVAAEASRVQAEADRVTAYEELTNNVNTAAESVQRLADGIDKKVAELKLPIVDEGDNGKFLRVVGGVWAADTVPSAEGEIY